MAVYLAADSPLQLVAWDDEAPGFHVSVLETERDAAVREQFELPYVYYAGSHTRCGCGFNYGQHAEVESDPHEIAIRQRSMAAMADYLTREIGRVGEIELFACWDGDQAAPAELHRQLTPSTFLSEEFYFYEREHSTIREDAA
jgi:hypothetical protein